jgi:hypothetical protein
MSVKSIQQHADDVQSLIETSRSIIAVGRFVDVSEVEQKVSRLFDTVSNNPQASIDIDVDRITSALRNLMNELDNLENDLKYQHQSLSAKNTVPPNSAAAAYQS